MEGYRQSKKNATAARPRSYKIALGFVKAIYVE
jgi:hypothetical protein